MRSDMFKVIVERPRFGAGHAPKPKLKRTKDFSLRPLSLKRHALETARYTKHLNENLAPLVRFFRSRLGQPWNAVFSEICTQLDTGSTIKMHVRLHIDDLVFTRISIGRYGEWLCKGQNLEHRLRIGGYPLFFVDPWDGLLKQRSELAERLPNAKPKAKERTHENLL